MQSRNNVINKKIVVAACIFYCRWLSHLKACIRFIARFETLVDTLDGIIESTQEPELQGIKNGMMKKDIAVTTLLLTDTLEPVNFLSLYLLEDCRTFTQLSRRVKCCLREVYAAEV